MKKGAARGHPEMLFAVIRGLVRRFERNAVFRSFRSHRGFRATEVQSDHARRRITFCLLAKLFHFAGRPSFPRIPIIFCHLSRLLPFWALENVEAPLDAGR